METSLIRFSAGDFSTVEGFPHLSQQGVLPGVAYRFAGEEVREVKPLGTCFSISAHGLTLTARHVVDEALKLGHWKAGDVPEPNQEWWLGAVYVRSPRPAEKVDDLFGGF